MNGKQRFSASIVFNHLNSINRITNRGISERLLCVRSYTTCNSFGFSKNKNKKLRCPEYTFKRNYTRSNSFSDFGEKIKNLGYIGVLVCVAGVFGYSGYILYDSMVAPNSPTRVYNEVLDLIRKDRKLAKLFGNSIVGYGEPSYSRLQRNRSISNKVVLNKNGEKLQEIRFYIEGEKEEHYGVVNAKLIEDQSLKSWRYYHISVDVYKTKKMDEAFEELAGKKDTKLIEAYSNRQNQTSLVTPNLSIDMFSSPEYLKEKQLELQRKRVHSGFFAPKNPKSNNDDGNASWFGIFKPSSRN